MNEAEVKDALHDHFIAKHVCFGNVKNGPSYGMGHGLRLLDFVAIRKSWAPVTIVGCEIKVSRQDFLRDDKWPEYLPLCNRFYWACPAKLLNKDELDPRAGLIYVYPSGASRTVRQAPFRDVEPDPLLLLYLILWREERREQTVRDRIVEEMKADADVGRQYAGFVARKLNEANKLLSNDDNVKEVRKWCAENDVSTYAIRGLLEAGQTLPHLRELRGDLEHVHSVVGRVLKAI